MNDRGEHYGSIDSERRPGVACNFDHGTGTAGPRSVTPCGVRTGSPEGLPCGSVWKGDSNTARFLHAMAGCTIRRKNQWCRVGQSFEIPTHAGSPTPCLPAGCGRPNSPSVPARVADPALVSYHNGQCGALPRFPAQQVGLSEASTLGAYRCIGKALNAIQDT
jgi:hypothetical protein